MEAAAAAADTEINECVWWRKSLPLMSPLSMNRLHVGTIQRHIKKISAAWKRFMTKKVVNLFQAAEISIVW